MTYFIECDEQIVRTVYTMQHVVICLSRSIKTDEHIYKNQLPDHGLNMEGCHYYYYWYKLFSCITVWKINSIF